MKHLVLAILTAAAALFSGCASTGSQVSAPTHYNQTEQATTQYPSANQPGEAYGYARGQASENQFGEAARWFEQAAGSDDAAQE